MYGKKQKTKCRICGYKPCRCMKPKMNFKMANTAINAVLGTAMVGVAAKAVNEAYK